MPDFDHHADIKILRDIDLVTAEIPLAGHASPHWISLFHKLTSGTLPSSSGPVPGAEAHDRTDRTWVIVRIPAPTAGPAPDPAAVLEGLAQAIQDANVLEQRDSSAARVEAAIRDWWVHQQR
jgi:hypothetical protein